MATGTASTYLEDGGTTRAPGEPRPVHTGSFPCLRAGQEALDVVTLALEPASGDRFSFMPGQFNMLTAFGVGEVPISISSSPGHHPLLHTIREVGPVTRALCRAPLGSPVGVRGPFGTDWGVEDFAKADAVVVAGGIGLAPLRGAVETLLDRVGLPMGPRRVVVLVGAEDSGPAHLPGRPRVLGVVGGRGRHHR